MSETWVKIIEDGIEYDIDEFAGLMFLDAKASYPSEMKIMCLSMV